MRFIGYAVGHRRRCYRGSRVGSAFLVAAMVVFTGFAVAQDYPAKPVRIVYPYAVGGGGDDILRMVADRLSRRLGQQFYVENRPGAAGSIGSEFVAKAAPDGYTLLGSGASSHVIGPSCWHRAGIR